MAEAMTNGHVMNHMNHQEFGMGGGALQENDHKSSSSHKEGGSSSKDRHHSSSKHSSSSSKHHSSSSKHRDGSSKHHHSSSSSKHKDGSSSSSKHRDGSSSKHRDGSHHSSSSSKHREGSHHSSSSSKHKDGSHHSSSKHKDGSSSSKHHSSSSKHHSSSSSKSHSSSSKHHHSSSKPKEGSHSNHRPTDSDASTRPSDASPDTNRPESMSPEPVKVKQEIVSPIKIKTDPTSPLKMKIKHEKMEDSEDDMPLSARFDGAKSEPMEESPAKRYYESDDDDEPLSAKLEKSKKIKQEKPKKRKADDEDFEPVKKKKKKDKLKGQVKQEIKQEVKKEEPTTKKGKKKKEEEDTKWKWWEEKKEDNDTKWNYLEHGGPVFAPAYEPLPPDVLFFYNGKEMKLTEECEEVATFYGRMLDHDYTTKEVFNRNFFKDWRQTMSSREKEIITDLSKCDFRQILTHFKEQSEKRKAMTKEEKQQIKKTNEELVEQYGWCTIDGHRQRIGNFRIEPPGLFRGRGDHPKQGMLKRRTMPEDVIINCSKDAKIPAPPEGHRWKEVRHDNKVTWLACWTENIQNSTKYVMLNAASKLKGEKDWKKYETARQLHRHADRIRAQYREDWKSKEMRVRQRAVAMYFIDKLALRAGNEKDEDQADTVGCCSLRVEHINLHEKLDDKEYVVEFDFLGKDSIRYYNRVAVEKRVFKNLQLFKENKSEGDDLFDRLNTAILNKHLQGLMEGLTAKVFRTFNASKTLQEQLDLLTKPDDPIPQKILSYNRANRAVAILCNHQRAAPKNFSKQMENMQKKIDAKKEAIHEAKRDVKKAKADLKALKTEAARKLVERRKKAVERLEEQLTKLEVQATDKDENKEIALGTSKLNYLDPRISIAWCKKWEVPIEKIYNKTQREKFAWAIDMADEDFTF